MAVRPHHGHDGGIVERRLRPIFDWLDNGNNKKALQEAEKVLKKSSNLQAAKALKALALLRLGKESEAHVVLDTLAEEKPTDDTTLQAMMIFYRESHQLHKMCALYEAAVKMEPTREEHHSNLFMSYVRVGDYLNQHRAAMALYKVAPKNPYYFWAVMSVVLQAKSTDNNTKKSVLLSLAERMVDNFITEKKMEAEQEARLYIMILELQEKWEVILKFMEGPIYQKLLPGAMPQASIPYLRRLGQWRKLNLMCKELLWEHLDRWDYYLPYFDSVFQLIKESSEDDGQADDTLEKCHEFICSLVENMGSKTMRGPYLARLELWRRLSETGEAVSLLGSGVALCIQYLRAFAHKPCALPDLRPYLAAIPQKEREEHCRHFLTCLDMDENTAPQTLEEVQRHVNCLGAWRLTAPVADASTALAVAESLRARYNEAADRGLAAGSATEFGPADQYALMAAHHYCYVAFAQQSSEPVVKALTLLDTVLQLSPANFHVKLLLVQLYHLLGNALAADSVYQRLDLKHVQLVSLGWTHAARLAPGLAPRRALALLADTNAFYTHHANDSVEQLTAAYKYGTFEKLCELDAWRTRLQRCAWCALVARERALLALLAAPPAPLHAPPPRPYAPHTDNRDLNAIVSWEPGAGVGARPELRARSAAQEEAYLDIKDALVSAMALCVELAADRSRERYDQLKACIETLEATFEKSKQMYGSREKICISAPFPSRIIALVSSPVPYRELYSCAFTAAGELALGELAAHDSLQRLQRVLTESAEVLGDAVRARMSHPDPLWTAREAFEDISNHLELLVIVTFVVGVCHELLGGGSGGGAAGRRRRRAAAASPQQGRALEALGLVNEATQAGLALLEELMDAWPAPTLTLHAAFDRLRVDDQRPSPPGPGVEERLRCGHQDMLDDLKNFLRKKSKYLKSLVQ